MEIRWSGGETMRSVCLHCGMKHVGKAIVLLCESQLGYPEHLYIALGNLSEAEDEVLIKYPKLAEKIRDIRLDIEEDIKNGEKLIPLLLEIMELEKESE